MICHGREPKVEIEAFVPFLERAALSPNLFDGRTDASVAAAHDAFNKGCFRVVPLDLHTMRFAKCRHEAG